MLTAVWDFLFTRRIWETVSISESCRTLDGKTVGYVYVLRDQFGNIKQKTVKA